MKSKILLCVTTLMSLVLMGCEDGVSSIGSEMASGEVSINVDSLVMNVPSTTVEYKNFDGRTITKLLGRINVPEYGQLHCSFLTQMMSAAQMNIPDSIGVNDLDSMRLVLSVPVGQLTGDSLAPQQLTVYRLNKALKASDINTGTNPADYYSPTDVLGSQSYSLSNIAKGDSVMANDSQIRIPIRIKDMSLARDLFEKYRSNSPIFESLASFNDYFKGIYVDQNFGNGCIANVNKAEFFTYWHFTERTNDMQPDSTYMYVDHIRRDSVCLMASQPEVISSNIISYEVSDYLEDMKARNEAVITSPGGYIVNIRFPADTLLQEYHRNDHALTEVSSLRYEIPATTITNDHNISLAPNLLMIRTSEMDSFFAENKIPDGITSFYAAYNSTTGSYQFNSMRDYFLKLLADERNGKVIDDEDMAFTLVPVAVTVETETNYDGSTSVYVTRCAPYVQKPTMTRLHTDRSMVCFTYTLQEIE